LKDAIALSVKQNRTLEAAQADIVIAEANVYGAVGNEDWLIDGSEQFTGSHNTGTGSSNDAIDTYQLQSLWAVTKPLYFGGRLGLRATNNWQHFKGINIDFVDGEPVASLRTDDTFRTSVQLTYFMPFLRGLGETTVRAQRHRAAAALDVAVLTRENTVTTVVNTVVQAYWELAYATKTVEIRKSSLDLAREQLRITQARLDVGVGAQTDVAAVKQGIATRESDLLIAELALSERALDLRQIVGLDITPADIELSAADQLYVQTAQINLEEAFTNAYARNPQIAILRAQGKQATIEVEIAEDGTRPQLDLTAAAGPAGGADNLGDSFSRTAQFKGWQASGTLIFQLPVGNHTLEGARRAAAGQVVKVRINEEDLKRTIAVSVAKAVNLVRSTEKRISVDNEAVQLAMINLNAEKARFEVGRTTNFEVLRRQDELAQSQLAVARDAADYLKARAGVQTLTGELLPAFGITVRPR
jgi:outer membrane protein TolC